MQYTYFSISKHYQPKNVKIKYAKRDNKTTNYYELAAKGQNLSCSIGLNCMAMLPCKSAVRGKRERENQFCATL
jgi:hypothetical protein